MQEAVARPMYDHLYQKLTTQLSPTLLVIEDESHRHNSGKGPESHFKVLVVSALFDGRAILERHRMVNAAVFVDGSLPVHALSIKAMTPAQYEKVGESALSEFKTPPCLGGHQ
jgi:stress-induced morphogen